MVVGNGIVYLSSMKKRVLLLTAGLTFGLLSIGLSQAPVSAPTTGYIYPIKESLPNKRVWVIGQRPLDAQGQLVGKGDIGLQLRQVFVNIIASLSSLQMTPANIRQITYHVRQLDSQRATVINQTSEAYLASTTDALVQLKNIPRLIGDDMLIEVEVVAIGL